MTGTKGTIQQLSTVGENFSQNPYTVDRGQFVPFVPLPPPKLERKLIDTSV